MSDPRKLNANAPAFKPPTSSSPTASQPNQPVPSQPQQPVHPRTGMPSLAGRAGPGGFRGGHGSGGYGNNAGYQSGFNHHAGGPPTHGHHHHGHHHHGHHHGHHHHGHHHHHGGHHHGHHHGHHGAHVHPSGGHGGVGPMHSHGHHSHHHGHHHHGHHHHGHHHHHHGGHHHGHHHHQGHHHGHNQSALPREQSKPMFVIMVCGTHRCGKTTIAEKLAGELKYNYISGREENAMVNLGDNLDTLIKQRRPNETCGFVLDDFLFSHTVDIHYIVNILKQHQLKLDRVVYLEIANDEANRRKKFETMDRIEHPVAYEVCSSMLGESECLFHVDCGTRTVEEVYAEILEEVQGLKPNRNVLALPKEELSSDLPMVVDYTRFSEVRKEVAELCKLDETSFPGSVPCRAMDYAQFSRYHHQLRSYHATFNYDGEHVLVVMHNKEVFVYLHNMSAIYAVPLDLSKSFQNAAESADDAPITFIFDAVLVALESGQHRIFLTDYIYLNGKLGSESLWEERSHAIKSFMAMEEADPFFLVSPAVKLSEISLILNIPRKFPILGLLFVHPGGYKIGKYDSQNFVFRLPEAPSIDVRIWGSRVVDVQETPKTKVQMWVFDGFVIGDDGSEVEIGEVRIPMATVENEVINDGNIVEVVKQEVKPTARTAANRNQKEHVIFKYKSRRNKKIHPFSKYMVERHMSWNRDSLVNACTKVQYKALVPSLESAPASPTNNNTSSPTIPGRNIK